MKRLAWLLLLPLAGSALFAASITGTVPNGTVGVSYSASLTVTPSTTAATWSISAGSLPPGLSGPSGTSFVGMISGTPTAAGTYSFTVQASLAGPNAAAILVTQAYTVVIAGPQGSPVSISTSSLPDGAIGVAYSQGVTAVGGYGLSTYTFALTQGSLPPGLGLNSSSGVIFGTPTTTGLFNFTMQVTSQVPGAAALAASATLSINIPTPPLTITTTSLPGGTVGTSYTATTLAASGGTPPYTWRLGSGSLPGGLTLATSGSISGTPTSAGSFTFQIGVSDSLQGNVIATFTIKITAAPLVVTTAFLPAGIVGTAYTATTLAATGGIPPYAWSLASGATLPGGLSITSAGVISGTPTAAGTFPVTVQVTDSAQVTATRSYSIAVTAPAVPLSITTQPPLPNGEVGVAYTQTFTATGGTPPYNFAVIAGAAPAGLALGLLTGSLTGTPTAAGTFNFTLQVADQADHSTTQAFAITVIAAVKIVTAPALPDGVTGVAYSQQLQASGGVTPYVWSVAAGTVPAGISLNTATGVLSGTPTTAGTYTFTIGVADPNGGKDSSPFTIKVGAPALSITTQYPLPGSAEGMVGVPFTLVFAATGGTPPYQWSVSAGALPTGLTLSAAGSLTGSPTATGTFNFTTQVTDSASPALIATKAFTIVVVQLTITTASPLPPAIVGTPYNQTLAVTGSGQPLPVTYTWSISTGALPAGISLNSSTGSLSGTPTAPGTFTFTVSVTGGGQTATKSFTITVAGVLTITTATLPNGAVGAAYTQALAATGGSGTLTWSISTGALPAGITLSSAGSLSGTSSAAGPFTFTVGVTDGTQTATKSLTITVAAVLTITTATLPNGTVGTAYSQPLAAAGGSGALTWSISTGALPTGITLSSAGSLTGTPSAAGPFTFTLGVTDGTQTATKSLTITVAAVLSITTATLPNGTVGTAYSQTMAAAGGIGTLTWSVSTGALPAGISLSLSTGSLNGTPTAAGAFTFTVSVTDGSQTATKSLTITVAAVLSIATATLPNGTVGAAYNQTLAATGGSGTLTWSISTGALPTGITLSSSTGSLSGSPSAPGAFTFTVSVTSGGQTAIAQFAITVGVPPAPSVTITGLPATASPATQPALGITIPSAYPLAITGQITLTFVPDAPSPDDGQEVVFTTGGRTASFTVAANSTQVAFGSSTTPAVQVGTVSGTITLTLKLTAAGIDITPSPAPSTKITIAKSAPFIKSATVTRTSSGFNLVVVGYATSREMVSATVGFTAAAGVTLASSSATVSLASVFASFYQTADPPYGSQFSLTMPFTFTNGASTPPLTSVSVQLTNAVGSSTSVSTQY
ncbi:MAG TPA: putative Ig domain-containing protein [Bryobacteraceae bacterium]|nr:putative Ig domain-containing protein [Bryobacteraceae bacterium]